MGALDHVNLHYVKNIDDVTRFIEWIQKPRASLGIDTETDGFDPFHGTLRMAQFGDLDDGWALPWHLWSGLVIGVLNEYQGPRVLQNSPFDIKYLAVHGGADLAKWDWSSTNDTMTMAHILDSNAPKGLKPLAGKLVDSKAITAQSSLTEGMSQNKWDWGTVPLDYPPYWIYAAMDPVLTCHVEAKLLPAIKANFAEVYQLEVDTLELVTGMMLKGAKVDIDYFERTKVGLAEFSAAARRYLFDAWGIENATSMPQVKRVLEDAGIKLLPKLTKSRAQSMDKEVLQAADHEVASYVLDIKKSDKLVNTYINNMLKSADKDHRVHPTIWAQGTKTGRNTITGPALQTLPKVSPIRGGFIPAEGMALISIDADQIEARLTAHFAEDQGMIDAFEEGDFFVNTARGVFQDETIHRESKERGLVKGIVYGKLYGAGVEKMAQTGKIPVPQMSAAVDAFESAYPGVKRLQQSLINEAKRNDKSTGRAFVLTGGGKPITVETYKEYTAMNYKIQGTAAEVFKAAIRKLAIAGFADYLMIPVHDEILMEVPIDLAEEVLATAVDVMNDFTTYSVPITWSGDIMHKSWGQKYESKEDAYDPEDDPVR